MILASKIASSKNEYETMSVPKSTSWLQCGLCCTITEIDVMNENISQV
jgi:hypothetical protein